MCSECEGEDLFRKIDPEDWSPDDPEEWRVGFQEQEEEEPDC